MERTRRVRSPTRLGWPWRVTALATTTLLLLAFGACCGQPQLLAYQSRRGPPPPPAPAVETPKDVGRRLPTTPTQTEFRNVDFRFDEDLVLGIRSLTGEMRGRNDGPVVFDDPTSFDVVIRDARTTMTATGLTALMRRYVFGYEGAPIRDIQVKPEGGSLRMSGVLHKVIDIPFEMRAEASATPDGWVRIHPVEMRICGLSGLGFLDALGVELDDLIDLKGAPPGIRAESNDLFLLPLAVLPAPRVRGHLTAVRIEGELLVLDFGAARDGSGPSAPPPPHPHALPLPDAPNYMYFWGGILHFGKLFMPDADMQVVDDSPADPFDFFLEQYNRQLVAGLTHNRADFGLEVHMIDYGKLGVPKR